VTHDQTEALVISDHIVVMNQGKIEQEGAPMDVYIRPRNRFTAEFLGRTNILPLKQGAGDPANNIVVAESGTRFSSLDSARANATDATLIAFRPEMVKIDEAAAQNRFDAKVVSCQFLGASTQLVLDLDGIAVTAMLPGSQLHKAGERVQMSVDPSHVLVLQD
jgi:ABC-type Fe3+/spermidine/putrescine transport system ATPase subunit